MGVFIEASTIQLAPILEPGKSARTLQEPNHDYQDRQKNRQL